MRSDKSLSFFVERLYVEIVAVVQRELVEERIPDPAVPHLIDILLALAGVSRVEVVGDVGYIEYSYVVGQVAVHGEHEVVVGDGVLDLHRHAVHISMDAAVGA